MGICSRLIQSTPGRAQAWAGTGRQSCPTNDATGLRQRFSRGTSNNRGDNSRDNRGKRSRNERCRIFMTPPFLQHAKGEQSQGDIRCNIFNLQSAEMQAEMCRRTECNNAANLQQNSIRNPGRSFWSPQLLEIEWCTTEEGTGRPVEVSCGDLPSCLRNPGRTDSGAGAYGWSSQQGLR